LGNGEWPVRCTVEISRDDYALLNQARVKLATRRQKIIAIVRLAIFVTAVAYLVSIVTDQSWVEFGIFLSVIATAFYFIMHRYNGRLNAWWYFKSFRVDKSPQTYEISPDGLSISSASFSGKFEWPAYHAIMRTPEHFLFWINPMQAHVVPFRTLENDDIDKVWALLEHFPAARVDEVRI